jgi:hypothetical protein
MTDERAEIAPIAATLYIFQEENDEFPLRTAARDRLLDKPE